MRRTSVVGASCSFALRRCAGAEASTVRTCARRRARLSVLACCSWSRNRARRAERGVGRFPYGSGSVDGCLGGCGAPRRGFDVPHAQDTTWGAPSIARGWSCSSRPTTSIGLHPAHHNAMSLNALQPPIYARLRLTSPQRGFKQFRPSDLPVGCDRRDAGSRAVQFSTRAMSPASLQTLKSKTSEARRPQPRRCLCSIADLSRRRESAS